MNQVPAKKTKDWKKRINTLKESDEDDVIKFIISVY